MYERARVCVCMLPGEKQRRRQQQQQKSYDRYYGSVKVCSFHRNIPAELSECRGDDQESERLKDRASEIERSGKLMITIITEKKKQQQQQIISEHRYSEYL